MPGKFAGKECTFLPHPGFDERMANPAALSGSAKAPYCLGNNAARTQVIQDPGSRLPDKEKFCDQRSDDIRGNLPALFIDKEAPVGVPVKGNSQIVSLCRYPVPSSLTASWANGLAPW